MSELAYDFEGSSYTTLPGPADRNEKVLRRLPTLLGRPGRSTLSLWVVPPGIDFLTMTPADVPGTFLQAAGTADAMTIEWRRIDDDGTERLYTLGHGDERPAEPSVTIEFFGGTRSTAVYPDEVFGAEEAGSIFLEYFQTQTVPSKYVLREFDLTWPKP
jgi:hypothetical protein